MLSKKTTHFLLAGMLVLTGVGATASEAPFKTGEQQKRALSLLGGIALAKQELAFLTTKKTEAEEQAAHFEGLLKPCITYVANERDIKEEREKCEIAGTEAFAYCNMALTGELMFSPSDPKERQSVCSKYRLLRDTGILLLPNRISQDGLTYVTAPK